MLMLFKVIYDAYELFCPDQAHPGHGGQPQEEDKDNKGVSQPSVERNTKNVSFDKTIYLYFFRCLEKRVDSYFYKRKTKN